MNLVTRLYPGDAVCFLVASILVQVAIIALLAVIAARTFARRNAALRHCILLSALFWMPLSPLASWRLGRTGLFGFEIGSGPPIAISSGSPEVVSEAAPNAPAVTGRIQDAIASPSAQPLRASGERVDSVRPLVSVAIILWLGGLVFLLIRLAQALRAV